MKRSILFLLVILLCATLVSCGRNFAPTVYEKDGYTVDLEAGTITKDEDVYTFSISGNGNKSSIHIVYPNGASYFFEWTGTRLV